MRRILLTMSLIFSLLSLSAQEQQDTINQIDENGMRQGYWEKKYPNGNLQYIGKFKNNKPTGLFRRYDQNGKLKAIMHHQPGSALVFVQMFYPNGNIQAEGIYIGRKKDSVWNFYSNEGYLINQVPYENDKKHGTEYKFYQDSTLSEIIEWENGLKHGVQEQYYPGGISKIKMHYSNGIREKLYLINDEKGNPIITGYYKNNLRHGIWRYYNEDYEVEIEIKYINGEAENQEELERLETEQLEKLEKNRGKYTDPTIESIFQQNQR